MVPPHSAAAGRNGSSVAEGVAAAALRALNGSGCLPLLEQQSDRAVASAADDAPPPLLASVFAAFVVERPRPGTSGGNEFAVVSFGIGTHAVGGPPRTDGADAALCLRDLHAEVLARRGLVAHLLAAAESDLSSRRRHGTAIEARDDHDGATPWHLPAGARVHLFVTQAPCGDASVFPGARHGARCFRGVALPPDATGDADAPALASHEELLELATCGAVAAGGCSKRGVAVSGHCNGADDDAELRPRLKPGKGKRSTSMSCSDKIAKWVELGLVGDAAGSVLAPVALASVTVLVDSAPEAAAVEQRLHRALVARQAQTPAGFTVAAVVAGGAGSLLARPFPRTGASGVDGGASLATTAPSSPVCVAGCLVSAAATDGGGAASPPRLLWRQFTGKEGAPQGSTAAGREGALRRARRASEDAPPTETPFCRRAVLRAVLRVSALLSASAIGSGEVATYLELKRANSAYATAKARFHDASGAFSDWVHDEGSAAAQANVALSRG
jgi:hypothetical protein